MQNRADFISLAGLRPDGRRPGEIRRLRCKLGVVPGVDGSAYLEMGQTKVLAIVKGPHEMQRRGDMLHDKGVINCEYEVAPFAGTERKSVRSSDRRSLEVALCIQEVFSAAVILELYPRSQINVYLHLIQADGSRLPACINATSLALSAAGISMCDLVVSCSAGYVDSQTIVDLNYSEQSAGGVNLPVAILPRGERILMAKMEARLPLDVFSQVLKAGVSASRQVHVIMQEALREHSSDVLAAAERML
jgi:exosome complex component RRP41